MRLAFALVALVATGGSLPKTGVLVPGRSLAGVTVGEPATQVTSTLGRFYGVCDGCSQKTWYFTPGRWQQSGLAVELERGRVTALYTVWSPIGWRTSGGMGLGATRRRASV